MYDDNPRFRIHAKQTAKNLWQFEGTCEYKSDKISRSTNADDLGQTVSDTLGLRLLSMIRETEKAFRLDGRMLVSDAL